MMPSDTDDKTLIARVSLYQGLSKARLLAPTYLRRNLTRVLDSHERQRLLEGSDTAAECAAATTPSNLNTCPGWAFSQLTKDMMRDLIRGQKPILSITSLSLLLTSPSPVAAVSPHSGAGDPDWLPRPNQLRLPCQVTVAIYEVRSTTKRIYLDMRRGTLIEQNGDTDTPGFEINLDESFRIEEDKLSTVTESDSEKGSWTREVIANTGLEIGIQFLNSDDTAELLRKIEGRNVKDSTIIPGREGILRASWTRLPELPAPGDLLPLKRARNHKSLDLRYGVNLRMGWNQQLSPLVRFNQALQHDRDEPHQLPTPSSEDLEEPPVPCTIKYLFASQFRMRSAVTYDLKCLLCPNTGKHSSFERLRLHFLTHHGHLQFELDESSEENDQLKIVRLSAEESRQPQEGNEMNWQAPAKAFDLAAHLDGISVWNPELSQQSRRKGTAKAAMAKSTETIHVNRATRKVLRPDEIVELPNPKRRKHEVPAVSGINFYRTTSKKQVEPGTLLGESDEEPDERWFEQATRRQLAGLGIDKISQDFHEIFNRHLDEENPMSDTLTADAVIRFARKYRAKLSKPRWRDKFEMRLRQLESRGVTGKETAEYCKKLLSVSNDDASNITDSRELPQEEGSDKMEGVIPESPVTFSSTESRTRWNDGRMSSAEVVFGHRVMICTRPDRNQTTGEVEISELVKDEVENAIPAKADDDIKPSDLEWTKFLRILDNDLVYVRGADNIVCISNGSRRPVVDEADWINALVQVQKETTGPIRFELCAMDFVEKGYENMSWTRSLEKQGNSKGKEPVKDCQAPPRQNTKTKKSQSCVCDKMVEGIRGTIACGDAACARVFHMQCVQLQKRPVEWKCADCSS